MKRVKCNVVLLLFTLMSVFAASSQINVMGRIVDEKGEPIPGVNVLLKGSNKGTASDIDGKFGISVPASSSVLRFSFIGYTPVEMKVETKPMQVVMKEEARSLEEVVVVGYSEVKRKDLTGSVAKANLDDMFKAPTVSLEQALAGRVAGVQVSSNEGMPGGGFNIVIRGNNSLTQENSPLYIIDGFPVEDANAAALNTGDIESVDFLKDASATAIYGARGANGVVIITTKKGTVGKPKLTYNGSFSVQKINNKLDLLNSYEFVKLQTEMYTPDELKTRYFSDGRTLENYRNYPMWDWQDEIFRMAYNNNHYVSIAGGTADTRYNGSLSYAKQQGIIINSDFSRFQGRFSLDQRINPKLKINLNANYARSITNGASPSASTGWGATSNLMYSVWGYRPLTWDDQDLRTTMYDPDVDSTNDYRFNPILSAKEEYRKDIVDDLIANTYAEYSFMKELKLKVSAGYRLRKRQSDTFNNSQTRYGAPTRPEGVNASVRTYDNRSWLNENVLTYRKSFNKKHNFTALAGVTFQGNYSSYYRNDVQQIANEKLGMSGLDTGTPRYSESVFSENKLMSYLGRIDYNYNSLYYATASFRADGSSKFSPKNRWGYFPSASLAWNFANETFMADQNVLSNGKLRVSWGMTGNNRVDDFAWMGKMYSSTSTEYPFEDSYYPGFVQTAMVNRDLKWETTDQANIGVDLGFIDNRIELTVDVYNKITRDLLLYADLPYHTGYSKAYLNIGKMRNRGLEITLNTHNIKMKNFDWTSSFNISFNQSRVMELAYNQETLLSQVSFDNAYQVPAYIAQVGKPLGLMYGYIYEGTYKYDDFDNKSGSYILKPNVPNNGNSRDLIQPGDAKYKDINGDGQINDLDRTIIGNGEPLHTGGFTNNFRYKNFDLNIFFQWSYGNEILNANRLMFENGDRRKDTNMFASYANRWTPENPTSDIPAVSKNSSKVFSSRVIEDGSYLRLKNVTLGYNFDTKVLRKLSLSAARVFVSGENLFTWTKYSGYDPEVSVRHSALTPGFDYSSYPRSYSFSLGLNVTF